MRAAAIIFSLWKKLRYKLQVISWRAYKLYQVFRIIISLFNPPQVWRTIIQDAITPHNCQDKSSSWRSTTSVSFKISNLISTKCLKSNPFQKTDQVTEKKINTFSNPMWPLIYSEQAGIAWVIKFHSEMKNCILYIVCLLLNTHEALQH